VEQARTNDAFGAERLPGSSSLRSRTALSDTRGGRCNDVPSRLSAETVETVSSACSIVSRHSLLQRSEDPAPVRGAFSAFKISSLCLGSPAGGGADDATVQSSTRCRR